jgi:hypothetical protein
MISKENKELLYAGITKLGDFFRILTENFLVANSVGLLDNVSLSAEERFEKFRANTLAYFKKHVQNRLLLILMVNQNFLVK